MKKIIRLSVAMLILTSVAFLSSCKKDDKKELMASFSYVADANNFLKITFTNESQNFESVTWDFGDGSAVSTEANPVYTYSAAGTYKVTITAKSGSDTETYSEDITLTDPNAELTKLTGAVSKTWKLVREGSQSATYYPLTVGELNPDGTRKGIWWQFGKNEELAKRPCTLNDEYTFTREGLAFTRDLKGDFWAGDGGIYSAPVEFSCQEVGAAGTTTNKEGVDITAWRNMTGTFVFTPGTKPTLKIVGNGAYIGLEKVATNKEVKVPQPDVTYNVARLVDADVDTLVLVVNYNFDDDPEMDAYWEFVLVHYDNPNDEPPMPGNKPSIAYTTNVNGLTVTFNNTTTGASTYLWDFGDGQTSNEMSPVHTYATGGPKVVKLTATNTNGTSESSNFMFLNSGTLTDATLQGAAWKIEAEEFRVFVGPGMGAPDWWRVPKSFLDGTSTGGDDWSCMTDDEFIFSAGGVFQYKTNGSARNDGYFGGSNGCIDDAAIAASGNGAAFGSATHSYVFTPANKSTKGRAVIDLTNGGSFAAFIGFYKGYYGGENTDKTKAPNGGSTTNKYEVIGYSNQGGKEYLYVAVDLTPDHSGGSSWSAILTR